MTNDAVDEASVTSSDDSSDVKETWFESNVMDEDSMDINKSTKDKLKRQTWISCYGLSWPNEEIHEFRASYETSETSGR